MGHEWKSYSQDFDCSGKTILEVIKSPNLLLLTVSYLTDILEDSPDEHHFPNLDELETHRLLLQLPMGHLRVLVHQAQLRILRPANVESREM